MKTALVAHGSLPGVPRQSHHRVRPSLLSVLMCFALLSASTLCAETAHPSLVLTAKGVQHIREALGTVPLFDATLARVQAEVDAEIAKGIDTPTPKDLSGGYTHERHKRNFFLMPKAGALFQVLGDERYAVYLRDMFFQYEAMYRDLPLHPSTRSYARGKLFWQCLNDANWLLYASQGYDAIYDWLSAEERERLEQNLFRPFADFLSLENPQFFNRIHNHSTWGTAAVGMIGLVMNDDALVQRALYGLDIAQTDFGARDNDGGWIRQAGQDVGFIANLDASFSPSGYYTEGPYYQRYAMYPFLMFAQSLANARPELGILEYRDGVLLKAVDALIQLSDKDGEFFPLNDAQKGMSYLSGSVVAAVDVAYHAGNQNAGLLAIAQQQGTVTLDDAGFAVAVAIRDGKQQPLEKTSANLLDGADGKQGGVAVLRTANASLELVFKYSSQGLSHGHYDKLSMSLYENGNEVLQDYGLVRFVNIGQKGGGNYLPENTSWAKQTIAHNTLTVDEASHFSGKYEIGSQHHSELVFFDTTTPGIQVVSAVETNAYPGVAMRRTLAVIEQTNQRHPIVLDLFRVESKRQHQLDLPFWFMGQHLDTDFALDATTPPIVLGARHGYQHLLVEARGRPGSDQAQFQWLGSNRFFTLTSAVTPDDEWIFVRLGANDEDFNLRRDAGLIMRRQSNGHSLFASAIEPHGSYSAVTESTKQPNGSVTTLRVIHDDDDYSAVLLARTSGTEHVFAVANTNVAANSQHELTIDGQVLRWQGPYLYKTINRGH